MANWKKIIVSGSNAELNQITGSGLRLNNLPGGGTTPLVIDSNGNVSTGSAYALASGGGGDTVGGSNLTSNVAIVGNGQSGIKAASNAADVDFNNANLKNIPNLTASNASFDTISIGNNLVFRTSSTSTELEIPSTNLTSFKIGTPVTMSNVPNGTNETNILVVGSSGEIVKRPSSDLGGVTQVNGGTNLSNDAGNNTGNVTLNLDADISLDSIQSVNITSSGIISASIITASSLKVSGSIDADGDISLDGTLSFNGFNFTQTNITTATGSTFFGSGSTGSAVQTTTHQFTGSVLITGSNLTLTDGVLTIPNSAGDGTINVAQALSNAGVASNQVSNSTFNNFTSSVNTSISALNLETGSINTSITALNLKTGSINSQLLALNTETGSINTSITALNLKTGSIDTSITALNNFTGSTFISSSVEGDAQGQIKLNGVNVDINGLGSGDSPTFNSLTLNGDLTVLGSTTTFTTQDLIVEDRFIYIGSGSSDTQDVGIIFASGSVDNKAGLALFYNADQTRLTLGNNVDSADGGEGDSIADSNITGDIVTVKHGQSGAPDANSVQFGKGEFYITDGGDVYIYTD